MPGGDGTGPMGMGPMTGRGAGYCAGNDVPGYANPLPGRYARAIPAEDVYYGSRVPRTYQAYGPVYGPRMGRGMGMGRGRGRGRMGWMR